MVNSVLTNFGSLVALQSLQATQKSLLDTQNRISTGLKIGSAKDDAATWAVSTQMKGSISNLQQVSSNLSQTDSVVGTAVSATTSIADLVSQIRTKVTAAQAPGTDAVKVQNDIGQLVAQIQSTVDAASFNGVNMLNSTGSKSFVSSVMTDSSGESTPASITVANANLNTTGTGGLAALGTLSVSSRSDLLFNDATPATTAIAADQTAYDTRQVSYAYSLTNLTAGTSGYVVNYVDSTGAAQTTNFTVAALTTDTASSTADKLNANTSFSALFHASADSATKLSFSLANRTETGSISSVTNGATLGGGGSSVSYGFTAANAGAASVVQNYAVSWRDDTGATGTTNLVWTPDATPLASELVVDAGVTAPATAAGIQVTATSATVLNFASTAATGKKTITGVVNTTAATATLGTTATIADLSTDKQTTLSFQDGVSLQVGNSFGFNFEKNKTFAQANTTAHTNITIQVSNSATGTVLSSTPTTDSNGNVNASYIVALNVNSVSGNGVSGATIASAVSGVLTSTSWKDTNGAAVTNSYFTTGTPAAGVSLKVTPSSISANGLSTNTLVISTAVATDDVQVSSSTTDYSTLLSQVDAAAATVTSASANFGSSQKRIETQKTFVDSLVSNLQAGVGNLIDADMSTESARLTALQVQQQLGTQALSIANQAPQSILSLFK